MFLSRIGFVGDVHVAARLLRTMYEHLQRKKHRNPVCLGNWLPRFFKTTYEAYVMKYKRREQVDFMVASAENGYMNILRRDLVDNLVEKVFLGKSPITRSSIPNFLVDIWRLDKKVKYVHLPGTSLGLLYVMRSPYFRIEQYDPLQFMAIGEGKTVMQALDYYDDAIYALTPGDSFAEASQFRQTIQRFISEQESIKSVGGLYPVIKVTGRGIENMGMGATIPVGGNRIQLS